MPLSQSHDDATQNALAVTKPSEKREQDVGRDWTQLPDDALFCILLKVGGPPLLKTVSLVCKDWRQKSLEDTHLWKTLYSTHYTLRRTDLWADIEWKKTFMMQHRWRTCSLEESSKYRPKAMIKCVASNGKALALCTKRSVEVWDLSLGQCTRDLHFDKARDTTCIAFCQVTIAMGSRTGVLTQHTLMDQSHRTWAQKIANCVLTCLAMDPGIIVTGTVRGTLHVEDGLQAGYTLQCHAQQIWCVAVNDTFFFTGSADWTTKIWQRETGSCLHTFASHSGPVLCLSVQGNLLATGSYDRCLRLWDLNARSCVHVFSGHAGAVQCVALNNMHIISSASDRELRIWDIPTGQALQTLSPGEDRMHFTSLKDCSVVGCGYSDVVRLWKLES